MPGRPLSGSSVNSLSEATASVLRSLASRASIIFVGRVVRVGRKDAQGHVDIFFRIDQPVRMPSGAKDYELREWAGLWTGGSARYFAGQRLLMLLNAPGPSGLSSPVGGLAGAIPLLATRQPPLLHGGDTAPAYTQAEADWEEAVDLRWVQALATRGVVLERFHPEGLQPVAPGEGFAAAQPLTQTATSASLSAVLAVLQPAPTERLR